MCECGVPIRSFRTGSCHRERDRSLGRCRKRCIRQPASGRGRGRAVTTTSDSAGQFVFQDIAPGDYLIDASAPGLTIAKPETLTVVAGENKHVEIHLAVLAVKNEVSVTAASEPQSVDQLSKALDTVNIEDAERRGLFSVADAIRFVPGLRISTRGSPGSLTTIQTRGLRATDTAVLIDGFRFRDPTSIQGDASAYIGDLLLVDASRIEVLRGSGSSLYGTNSMSGTVNIITDSGGGPAHGDVDLQGGGLGLFRGVARVAGGALNNRLAYSVGVSHLNVTEGVDDVGAVRDWSGQTGVNYAITPKIRVGVDVFANTGYLQQNVSPSPTANAPMTGIIPAIPLTTAQIRRGRCQLAFRSGERHVCALARRSGRGALLAFHQLSLPIRARGKFPAFLPCRLRNCGH